MIIADDFNTETILKSVGDSGYNQQEVNLFYVACTRAINTIQLPKDFLEEYQYSLEELENEQRGLWWLNNNHNNYNLSTLRSIKTTLEGDDYRNYQIARLKELHRESKIISLEKINILTSFSDSEKNKG